MTSNQKRAETKRKYKEDPDYMMRKVDYPIDKRANKAKKGDNTKFLEKNLAIFTMGKVNLGKPKEVEERIQKYFEVCKAYDAKPSITSFSMAIGMARQRLYEIVTGRDIIENMNYSKTIHDDSRELIRKVYALMDAIWEDYMLNGKVNPASGIFLGKNHFGYRDTSEHVFTKRDDDAPAIDLDSIKSKYLQAGNNKND